MDAIFSSATSRDKTSCSIQEALRSSGLPLLEARYLLSEILNGVSTAYLIAHSAAVLSTQDYEQFQSWVARRLQGEPVAYILKHREFWGRKFICSPGVLIPRPDTETLLEAVLNILPVDQPARVVDLGTGTGILAVSIACERPLTQVWAVDRSPVARSIASQNAIQHQVAEQITIIESDWFKAFDPALTFDVILSNPPYIDPHDIHLSQGDLRFEPLEALRADHAGYQDLFDIIDQAPRFLKKEGWLYLEHGYNQGGICASRFDQAIWYSPEHHYDLSGWIRVTGAQKK